MLDVRVLRVKQLSLLALIDVDLTFLLVCQSFTQLMFILDIMIVAVLNMVMIHNLIKHNEASFSLMVEGCLSIVRLTML